MKSTSALAFGLSTRPESRGALRLFTSVDWTLLGSALLLALIGLATIHSASTELAVNYLPRQVIWLLLGVVAMILAASLDTEELVRWSPFFYGLGILSLISVHIFGYEAGGAQSRIAIGSVSVQPSEFAKLATALLLAHYLGSFNRSFLGLRHLFIAAAIVALPVLLVAAEPDQGSAAMFLPMVAGMLLVAGVRKRTLIAVGLLAMVLGAGIWSFGMRDYQRQRVLTFLQPGSDPLGAGYQVRQSQIAVGSGGLAGRGYKQGTQSQLRFLPARHTDFVFAVLAEEWGFVGVTTTLSLYGLFIVSASRIATRARSRSATLLVIGLTGLLAFHALYNTAMVVGLVPITGIPLPFLSYGGSFTLMCFVITGLILGVDLRRYVNR